MVDEAIPSLKTGVRLRSGSVIDLYGMHPQPPAPQQDSAEREYRVALVAKEIRASTRPSIVLGDLNDVAWSVEIVEDMRLSEIFVPYHPGSPRFFDISGHNFPL